MKQCKIDFFSNSIEKKRIDEEVETISYYHHYSLDALIEILEFPLFLLFPFTIQDSMNSHVCRVSSERFTLLYADLYRELLIVYPIYTQLFCCPREHAKEKWKFLQTLSGKEKCLKQVQFYIFCLILEFKEILPQASPEKQLHIAHGVLRIFSNIYIQF